MEQHILTIGRTMRALAAAYRTAGMLDLYRFADAPPDDTHAFLTGRRFEPAGCREEFHLYSRGAKLRGSRVNLEYKLNFHGSTFLGDGFQFHSKVRLLTIMGYLRFPDCEALLDDGGGAGACIFPNGFVMQFFPGEDGRTFYVSTFEGVNPAAEERFRNINSAFARSLYRTPAAGIFRRE